MPEREAIHIALDLLASPSQARILARLPLPDGVSRLVRLAADDSYADEVIGPLSHVYGASRLRQAACDFLSHVTLVEGGSPFRCLGLPDGAPTDKVREHKRLLVRWLHPDRNNETRAPTLLARVIAAADLIEANGGKKPTPQRPAAPAQQMSRPMPPPRRPIGPPPAAVRARAGRRIFRSALRALMWAGAAVTALAIGLAVWRAVMQEPIGESINRLWTSLTAAGP